MKYGDYLACHLVGVACVNDEQVSKLQKYIDELLRWNKKVNLTAITDLDGCWEKHVLDSLFLASMLGGNESLLDIGSGAGLPSIPLKIVFPGLQILSVDSVAKKINFQRHVCRKLELPGFSAEAARVESLTPEYSGQFDVVTSRAFASLDLFLKQALPFVANNGRLLAMKSSTVEAEIDNAKEFMVDNGLYVSDRKSFVLPKSNAMREILEIRIKQRKI